LSQILYIFGTISELKTIEKKGKRSDIFFIFYFTELIIYEAIREALIKRSDYKEIQNSMIYVWSIYLL
jgi:hypothetical protein